MGREERNVSKPTGGKTDTETGDPTTEYTIEQPTTATIGLETADYGSSDGSGIDTTEKRGRGRPKGTGKNQRKVTEKGTYSGQVETKTVGKKKSASAKQPTNTDQFVTLEEATATTDFILSVIETYATHMLGAEAQLSDVENILLRSSLPPYLATMKKSSMERLAKIAYPVAIVSGFGLYGSRLMRIAKQNQEDKLSAALYQEQLNTEHDKQKVAEERLNTPTWNTNNPLTPQPTPTT